LSEPTWTKVAEQGETVELPADSTVRYGVSPTDRYVERVVSGPVPATNVTFGDPAPTFDKWLWLRVAADEPPVPTPPSSPPEPPMPGTITIPPHPGDEPAASADWQTWDVYLRRLSAHLHAQQAQVRHEDEQNCIASRAGVFAAMEPLVDKADAALGRFSGAVQALASAIASQDGTPAGVREVALELLKSYPQCVGDTDLTFVRKVKSMAEEFVRQLPAPQASEA
jgi:hypothetical protein